MTPLLMGHVIPCIFLGNPRQSLNAGAPGVFQIPTVDQAKCLTANSSLCILKHKVRFRIFHCNSYRTQHHQCHHYTPNSLSEDIFSTQNSPYLSLQAFLAPLWSQRSDDFNTFHSERSSTLARSLQGTVAWCHPQCMMNGASRTPGDISGFIYFIFLLLSSNSSFPYGACFSWSSQHIISLPML